MDENTPVRNPDAYGTTKHLAERLLAENAPAIPCLALRLPGVLGPGAHRNWLSGVAAKLRNGASVPAFNIEAPFNNAVHVSDLAEFVAGLLQRPWSGFDAMVLGASGMTTVNGAIERLAHSLGVSVRIDEKLGGRTSFTLSSERAIGRWGYRAADIHDIVDRYGADVLSWRG